MAAVFDQQETVLNCVRTYMSMTAIAELPVLDAAPDVRDPVLRLAQLFDDDDWELLNSADGDEVQAATGRINGSRVFAYCTDARRMGGALSVAGSRRIVETIEVAVRERAPVIGIWHSGGAKHQGREGSDHHHVAMREVGHAQDAEHHRQPDRHQCVQAPKADRVDDLLRDVEREAH